MTYLLGTLAGLVTRVALLAAALVYGLNVGQAAEGGSVWRSEPWLQGAIRTAFALAEQVPLLLKELAGLVSS